MQQVWVPVAMSVVSSVLRVPHFALAMTMALVVAPQIEKQRSFRACSLAWFRKEVSREHRD